MLFRSANDMDFQYTLTPEEYEDFCKYELYVDPTMRKFRKRCWVILPIALVFLAVLLYVVYSCPLPIPAYILIAIVASLLWVYLVNWRVSCIIRKGARAKCEQAGEAAFQPLHVVLEEGSIQVNKKKQTLKNYTFFSNLIILLLGNDSLLILPQRVFGAGNENLRQVIDALKKCQKS